MDDDKKEIALPTRIKDSFLIRSVSAHCPAPAFQPAISNMPLTVLALL